SRIACAARSEPRRKRMLPRGVIPRHPILVTNCTESYQVVHGSPRSKEASRRARLTRFATLTHSGRRDETDGIQRCRDRAACAIARSVGIECGPIRDVDGGRWEVRRWHSLHRSRRVMESWLRDPYPLRGTVLPAPDSCTWAMTTSWSIQPYAAIRAWFR